MSDLWRDLAGVEPPSWETWDAGRGWYQLGYMHGLERGREYERAEVSALQRTAMETIHRLAELDERDRAVDERAAEGRRAWWQRRRGEA